MSTAFTLNFSEIRMTDVAKVGGKNASLGELFNALATKGVGVLDGFATNAYWRLLQELGLRNKLETLFSKLDAENLDQLAASGHAARTMILETPLPLNLCSDVVNSYRELMKRLGGETELAVRSPASAEDLREG